MSNSLDLNNLPDEVTMLIATAHTVLQEATPAAGCFYRIPEAVMRRFHEAVLDVTEVYDHDKIALKPWVVRRRQPLYMWWREYCSGERRMERFGQFVVNRDERFAPHRAYPVFYEPDDAKAYVLLDAEINEQEQ